ncbi:MAG TPA: histidine phosphatase family protein [Polyangiaceae bacterium]|jgi:probable phosphoglycerate mutase
MTTPRVLYALRHGETHWNAEVRWQGHTDIPLNEIGRTQAREVAERLRALHPSGVASSDLSRARETAEIIAAALGLPEVYVDAGLRERAFGVFEGLTRGECEERHATAWRRWQESRHPPEGGEAHDALAARAVAAMGRVAERIARDDAPAIVVTHGGTLRAVVFAAKGVLPAPVKNAAVWRLTWDGKLVDAVEL